MKKSSNCKKLGKHLLNLENETLLFLNKKLRKRFLGFHHNHLIILRRRTRDVAPLVCSNTLSLLLLLVQTVYFSSHV